MNQFNISYQISFLHEALVTPLGSSTLLNAIFPSTYWACLILSQLDWIKVTYGLILLQ